MSCIQNLESVASSFEHELRKLWNHEPKIAAIAATTISFVTPILELVFTVEAGPAAGAEVGLVIGRVQQSLLAVSKLVTLIGPTPSVKGLVLGAQEDLGALLAAAAIKNPASVANVNLVIGELAALAGAFPAAKPESAASASTAAQVEASIAALAALATPAAPDPVAPVPAAPDPVAPDPAAPDPVAPAPAATAPIFAGPDPGIFATGTAPTEAVPGL